VISAKGRQNLKITDFEDFLQTDAAINPGNSGGPLINLSGEAIGINTAIVSKGGGYMGIGFAIPSNMAKYIMQQIIDSGTVTRSYLGVVLQPLDQDMADAFDLERPEGALVAEVVKGSPAEAAGLKQGDIIVQYDNTPVKSIGSFRNEIAMMKPGTKVNLKVNRNGKIITCAATLANPAHEVSSTGLAQKLGMEVEPLTPELAKTLGYTKGEEGVVVSKIKPGSISAMAGIRPGFLIMAINHKKVVSIADFNAALEDVKNKRLLILAKQGDATRFYSLKIE
jgi:serine protease Do